MEKLYVHGIPAIIFGEPSKKIYLYIHGQGGCKEEAEQFANIANRHSWQIMSIDLPEHGERKHEKYLFNPWSVVPELKTVMKYVSKHWTNISLIANSIGVWFSMLSFDRAQLENSLFVSPVLNMEHLISKMMLGANVSESRLKRERTISNPFGPTFSWKYLQYAKDHQITDWPVPTKILYGENDSLIERKTLEDFARRFDCKLKIMPNGEHWFHTQKQKDFLCGWVDCCLQQQEIGSSDKQKKSDKER